MKFNEEVFNQKIEGVKLREDTIEVINPSLKKLFTPEEGEDENSPPFWRCRQLTAIEIALVNQQVENSKNTDQLIERLWSNYSKEKINAIKNIIGFGEPEIDASGEPEVLPEDYIRRMYVALYGLIDPKPTDIQWVRKFARNWPQEFMMISTKILSLTGFGASLGE